MNNLCDECETVNHCLKNGCIPKQPPATKEVVEMLFLARTMNMAASNALTILREAEAKMIAAASADQSGMIYQMQMLSGAWIDQSEHSYEYNKKHGHTVRIVYASPQPAPVQQEPDYKALYEQACERLDALDKELAKCEKQAPVHEQAKTAQETPETRMDTGFAAGARPAPKKSSVVQPAPTPKRENAISEPMRLCDIYREAERLWEQNPRLRWIEAVEMAMASHPPDL